MDYQFRKVARHSERASDDTEAGVSGIIELVIVLVILGILTAILLPTFLGTTQTAKVSSAESNLGTTVADSQSFFATSGGTFGTSTTAVINAIKAADPGLTVGTTTTNPGDVAVLSAASSTLVVGVYSQGFLSGAGGCAYASINNGAAGSVPAGVSYAVASGSCAAGSVPTSGWNTALPSSSSSGGGGTTDAATTTISANLAVMGVSPVWLGNASGFSSVSATVMGAVNGNSTLNAAFLAPTTSTTTNGAYEIYTVGNGLIATGVYSTALGGCVFQMFTWNPGNSYTVSYAVYASHACSASNFTAVPGGSYSATRPI